MYLFLSVVVSVAFCFLLLGLLVRFLLLLGRYYRLVSLVVERALPEQAGTRGRGRGIRWSFSLDILSGVLLLSSPYTACVSSAPIFLVLEHGIILHLFKLSYSSPKVEFSDRVSVYRVARRGDCVVSCFGLFSVFFFFFCFFV